MAGQQPEAAAPQSTVIPGADSLIGDLLDMDLGPPIHQQQFSSSAPAPPAGVNKYTCIKKYLKHAILSYQSLGLKDIVVTFHRYLRLRVCPSVDPECIP